MSGTQRVGEVQRTVIEQAIARRGTVTGAAKELDLPVGQVQAVFAAMLTEPRIRKPSTKPRRPRRVIGPVSHGSHSSYNHHRAVGEKPCDECKAAEKEYGRQRKLAASERAA